MDLTGSLVDSVDTRLKIYPPQQFITFLNSLRDKESIPNNILKLMGVDCVGKLEKDIAKSTFQLNDEDTKNINKIIKFVNNKLDLSDSDENDEIFMISNERKTNNVLANTGYPIKRQASKDLSVKQLTDIDYKETNTFRPFLTTSDIDWLYSYLQERKSQGDDVPYLHVLLEGANVEMPENENIRRNPELEARCVQLRAEQDVKEYTTMTLNINVDDLRLKMKLLEDISNQKSVRQRGTSKLANLSKYFRKRSKSVKKEHQD